MVAAIEVYLETWVSIAPPPVVTSLNFNIIYYIYTYMTNNDYDYDKQISMSVFISYAFYKLHINVKSYCNQSHPVNTFKINWQNKMTNL